MFEHNPLTKRLGCPYPIIQAGMVWTSGWRLAAAAAEAGALGVIGAASMTPDLLREHIRKARAATSAPLAVNLPLIYAHVDDQIDVLLAEGVQVVITSAGNPARWTPVFREHGVRVLHVVSSARFAAKAEAAGCDAVICEGFEAGGHNGREETTTLVLVPLVRRAVRIPVVAAGGIASGEAMLAAMILGADGVQLGSRFAATREASGHPDWKARIRAAGEGDTALALKPVVPVRLLKNRFYEQAAEAEARGASAAELRELLGKGRSRRGMFEGDLEEGELEIGQVAALIEREESAAGVVADLLRSYRAARAALQQPESRF